MKSCEYKRSKIFFKPVVTKFHTEPPGKGGKKLFPNYPGYIINMAAMPIYGKIF